jgi:NADPH-dependent glutamate synthase beta subunit-like oxidoreductase/dihydroorotate dehydrogenase/NAD-dependent dihydropyrimidine dehydrogenase PreA subunit
MNTENIFLTDAQLKKEILKCEYCEEKPCKDACPTNCSPADFIIAAKTGFPSDIRRSACEILRNNPLGGICGIVCPDRHCMASCTHKKFDGAVNIPAVQATIIAKAKELGVMPESKNISPNGKKVAVIGAGPSGLGAAAMLARKGYKIDILEKEDNPGGFCNLIPDFRLPNEVLKTDIDFVLSLGDINIKFNSNVDNPVSLLDKDYDAVLVTLGLTGSLSPGIENEELAIYGTDYLKDPCSYNMKGRVAIIGGGATACDCALSVSRQDAESIEIFMLENLEEMPLTEKEMKELIQSGTDINGRIRVKSIIKNEGRITGIETLKVNLPQDMEFHPKNMENIEGTSQKRNDISKVIIAIGNKPEFQRVDNPKIFYAGDYENGPTTVVEAVAAGKNVALEIHAYLSGEEKPDITEKIKSIVVLPGFKSIPVPLDTDFFGRPISSPFLLSASPLTDGLDQMKAAFDAGWSGAIMKTAFDDLPIHIPERYMNQFNELTYGNCDNVSGHTLDRVCREIEQLLKEYPDRLIAASTGGPVTGNNEEDKIDWQSNTKKLEQAGAMAIEYSLSCPQGGDGTEGDIVSQNAALTATIIEWIMEAGVGNIPKLFKLTAAVTSIIPIANAIKKVLDRYPDKKAGITLANTFPTVCFKPGQKKEWEEGIVVGMGGEGVTPISYLTLAKVAPVGLAVSGNGGPMNYKAAADFLALGVKTVQFCSIATKYGYHIFDELTSGLSHLMKDRGIKSVHELIGIALPNPIIDFMSLSPVKMISDCNTDLCLQCGNCLRCPYMAISFDEDKYPITDPEKCIGCGMCNFQCFTGALSMRDRTPEEAAALIET